MFFNIYISLLTFFSNIMFFALIPFMWKKRPKNVKNILNIKYGPEKWARYDLHMPKKEGRKPLFIYIHGGGFISGSKGICRYYCYEYAKKGYAVMNVNYQYAPKAKYPDQLKQIFKAIEQVLDRADELGIDREKIVVGGESAGAYLSVVLAGMTNNKKYYKYCDIDFKYEESFKIAACVLICGIYRLKGALYYNFSFIRSYFHSLTGKSYDEMCNIEDERFFDWYSPLNLVDENFPASVVIHATHDTLKTESNLIANKMDENGVPNIRCASGGLASHHAFPINTFFRDSRTILNKTFEFLDEYVIRKGF